MAENGKFTQLDEADIRRSIQSAFVRLGGAYYHAPDVKIFGDGVRTSDGANRPSRPDTIILWRTAPVIIEVKRVGTWLHVRGESSGYIDGTFSPTDIRDNQRHLLDSMTHNRVPTYLGIGNVPKKVAGSSRREILKIEQKKIYLIPWVNYFMWEAGDPKFSWTALYENFAHYLLAKDVNGYYFPEGHDIYKHTPVLSRPFEWVDRSQRYAEESNANGNDPISS